MTVQCCAFQSICYFGQSVQFGIQLNVDLISQGKALMHIDQ